MSTEETQRGEFHNGQRVDVTFGDYTGKAGVVLHKGERKAAFFTDFKKIAGVKNGVVDDVPVTVLRVEESIPKKGGVKGMVVIVYE